MKANVINSLFDKRLRHFRAARLIILPALMLIGSIVHAYSESIFISDQYEITVNESCSVDQQVCQAVTVMMFNRSNGEIQMIRGKKVLATNNDDALVEEKNQPLAYIYRFDVPDEDTSYIITSSARLLKVKDEQVELVEQGSWR